MTDFSTDTISGGQIMAPKDINALILGTCVYVNFYDKRDIADIIKLAFGDGEIILDYSDGPSVITSGLIRER